MEIYKIVLTLCISRYVTGEAIYYDIVFRGVSGRLGGTGSIYQLWRTTGSINADVTAAKAIGSRYAGHYKSPEVDKWNLTTFTKVKLAVYKNGKQEKYFVFDATGTNKMTWMTNSLMSASSYNFHGASFNHFSIQGDEHLNRRFFINHNYAGCENDYGWLVYPESETCEWEQRHANPTILYNTGNTSAVNWLHGEEADEMVIFFGRPISQIDPCIIDEPVMLPNLESRAPFHTSLTGNDDALEKNWYSAGDYEIVTDSSKMSAVGNKCGAEKYVWMDEALPEADGKIHPKKVCIADPNTGQKCALSYYISVKKCDKRYLYLLNEPYMSGASYCFDISKSFDPCSVSHPSSVPDLEKRRPIVTSLSHSDNNLQTGWYTAHTFDIFTFTPRNVPACGTNIPIWMNATIPDADGQIHWRSVCVVDGSVGCKYQHTIYVKNCGSHRMYHLTVPRVTDSAYCFDIKTETDDPAPDYKPATATIEHDLRWEVYLNGVEKPNLLFRCVFETSNKTDLYYSVFFYVDGEFTHLSMLVKASNKSEALISEQSLASMAKDYNLGITISCLVGARTTATGRVGDLTQSKGFYAGLKVVNKTINIERGGKETLVYFYPTVPYACLYYPTQESEYHCYVQVTLVTDKSTNGCYDNAVSNSGKCSTKIDGVTKAQYSDSAVWFKNYSFTVQNTDSQKRSYYLRHQQFQFQLETPGFVDHGFWKNAVSEKATINVHDSGEDYWMKSKCEIYCDPHMLTFDRVRYELQFGGTFVAYRHLSLPIEVQVEITSCYHNGRTPYCVCGLAVIAGEDVFRISTCDGQNTIDYESCKNSVLKTVKKRDNIYEIYLPTGALVTAVRRTFSNPNIWDVDIRPTVHEIRSTTGLCGSLDNNKCNDIDPILSPGCSGGYQYHVNDGHSIIKSNKVTNSRSFVRTPSKEVFDELKPYPDASYQVCVCPYNSAESSSYSSSSHTDAFAVAECSYRAYATCDDSNREIKCILHEEKRRRKRRSVDSVKDTEMPVSVKVQNRFKRTTSYMSEPEARAKCEAALTSSQTYGICSSLGVDATDAEINNCVLDLMLSGDENWILAAQDRRDSSCLTKIASNSTLQEENANAVSLVQNITCPNSCSNKGICENGECVCNEGFASDDCSYNMSAPLKVVGLSNDGLCDLQHSCDAVYVNGEEFPSDKQYTCQFKIKEVFNNWTKSEEVTLNVTGSHRTVFQLECKLPAYEAQNNNFALEYSVGVRMDGQDFSEYFSFVVLDTTCQQYNVTGQTDFSVQNGYCFIDKNCIPHSTKKSGHGCYECNYFENVFEWHPSSSVECSVSSKTSESQIAVWKILVGVFCWLTVLLVMTFGMVYLKGKFSKTSRVDNQTLYSTHLPEKNDKNYNIHLDRELSSTNSIPPIETKFWVR